MPLPSYEDFEKLNIMVGRIARVEEFPEAKKPAYRLWIDFGKSGIKQSSAQLTRLYKKGDLPGRLIIGVTGFPPRQIASFISEVLVLGVIDKDSNVVLLKLDKEERIEPGSRIC
ncbi:MAG: tRNA-binding protein [Candidatus Aenigmarchaeota archaeon]|nr:tRNA-binding protein [Candidatus Aenigmarchaeota archaeon]